MGVIFPNDPLAVPRHPSQLYEFALEGVVLFAILYFIVRKPRTLGLASGAFLIGYGVFRTIVELFREPDAHLGFIFSGITQGQILSVPMIIVGIVVIFVGRNMQAKAAIKENK